MDVFDLDRSLIDDYSRFARSFAAIRAADIREKVDHLYESGRFWPDPLISINPHFERGPNIDQLVAEGRLAVPTGQIFRADGKGLQLHLHQGQAVSKAAARQSFVVTTGTGSGKSLCFFIPIIDSAVRARLAGEPPRTRAIVVYPMNALANSQMEELSKFIVQSGLDPALRPTFALYTGQEDQDQRNRIREAKPDILLTNFMMLELLLTRQQSQDRDVIASATGLDFLVLDELHTYRGRQGADVAMLVRRVRDRLCRERPPVVIGTSATMASEGDEANKKAVVAGVASRLFGTKIGSDAVIDESLRRATDPTLKVNSLRNQIVASVDAPIPEKLSDDELFRHPLAVWVELELGLEDGKALTRRTPIKLSEGAQRLATAVGRAEDHCKRQLEKFLTVMSLPADARGGEGDRAFMAFKLHRFISGAGFAFSSLRKAGSRSVTLEGQQFDPEDTEARLYPTHFCRSCGQEYHPVTIEEQTDGQVVLPRSIDDVLPDNDEGSSAGYLVPFEEGDEDFVFDGAIEAYPEEWVDGDRLKPAYRHHVPEIKNVAADGQVGKGRPFWFIPGKFRFCLCCKDQPAPQAREMTKLGGLSAEGRSSATTLLVSSALRWMNRSTSNIELGRRKLLSFTDNRQDAALQAGHFNDTVFVGLLRGAIVSAVRRAGEEGLSQEQFGPAVQQALGFNLENKARRPEWMLQPDTKGSAPIEASRSLARVLAYRVWSDQRKGWRYTNPNLEETGLIRADYHSLDELAADDDEFSSAPGPLRVASQDVRKRALLVVLETLRGALAINAEPLEAGRFELEGTASRQVLREPWLIGQREEPRVARWLMVEAPRNGDRRGRDENLILRGGTRSALARELCRSRVWGGERLERSVYLDVLHALLGAAENYGLVRRGATTFGADGWQLVAGSLRLKPAAERADGKRTNQFFRSLYVTIADALDAGGEGLFGMEGREHTAQVEPDRRMWREWRFRWGKEDRENIIEKREILRSAGEPDEFLPVLFCSPTMELGVDISAMNAVYLRNVPPTPANYAQRSGRAGRSGQAALVVTYCAAQSPHDQYYFARPTEMVRGVVRPPALDIANRELVEAHLHAVWLAETNVPLPNDIPALLELSADDRPIKDHIAVELRAPGVEIAASAAMLRILNSISNELTPSAAPWAVDRESLARETANLAFTKFSHAFDRWRTLYDGAHEQLQQAHKRLEQTGLNGKERAQARELYNQANDQIGLLERSGNLGSDFYSYRYLATEGFLPGYNFPRLPLYAFIPAAGGTGSKGTYLQRARFLAISEFGPGSLIYHEGRAYRVNRARLAAGTRGNNTNSLVTSTLYVCEHCGASHDRETERCHSCSSPMNDALAIRDVLRIENVETQPQERITANDEERQRRGFDLQTMFEWPERDGALDVRSATAIDQEGPILTVDYSQGALVRRVNKGLRRRTNQAILGFKIDPSSGRWVSADTDDDGGPEGPTAQRVVPVVQDTKNIALLRLPGVSLSEQAMATLQHALTRGMDIVYQLEESEMLSEPVPTRENRRAILSLEATEGGAGVLSRLISEPDSLSRVARAALELMHYENIASAVASGTAEELHEPGDIRCVKGCYRCLLSYYNQPDHELIDRTDPEVLRILIRLARGTVQPSAKAASSTGLWSQACSRWKLPVPDTTPLVVEDTEVVNAWRKLRVAGVPHDAPISVRRALEAKGYTVVDLPEEPAEEAPEELRALLGETA